MKIRKILYIITTIRFNGSETFLSTPPTTHGPPHTAYGIQPGPYRLIVIWREVSFAVVEEIYWFMFGFLKTLDDDEVLLEGHSNYNIDSKNITGACDSDFVPPLIWS